MAECIKSKGPTLHTLMLLKNYKGHTKSFSNTSSQLGCRRTGAAGLVKEKRSSHTQHARLHTAPLHSRRCLLLYALNDHPDALVMTDFCPSSKLSCWSTKIIRATEETAREETRPGKRACSGKEPGRLQQHDQPMRLFTDTANKRH
ncbi:uncharacterized protein RAG0_10690 [Rhynchosporium agropyri]|uniref:Uncharacterized protein n=1 Tax=Rhynchosporium agropyri TaxID=914238 RepID=A0A1E1L0S5_9HELO|nr:uncharacterized protein RAG0_10690 [Rhynchosporium agropyri]